jgi:peptidoglycan DL-endopeptidase CwlO
MGVIAKQPINSCKDVRYRMQHVRNVGNVKLVMSRRASVAVVLAILLSFGASLPASADAVSDRKAEAARIAAKKDKLREQHEVLAEKINASVEELANIEKDVGVAEVQLGEQEAAISKLGTQAFQFAVNSYVLGSESNGLGTILAPGGIGNDSAQRDGYSAVLLGGSADVTDQVKAVRQDTDRIKVGLLAKLKRQSELKLSLEKDNTQIEGAQVELDKLEKQNDAALAQAIKDAEEANRLRLEAEAAAAIRRQSEAFRQSQAAAAAPATGARTPAGQPAAKPAGGAPAKPAAAPVTAKPKPGTPAPAPGAQTTVAGPATTKPAAKPRPTPPAPPAVSGAAGRAVAAAYSQLGVPYVFATAKPGVSFDCSGLTSWAWSQAGVSIPRTSQAQWAGLPHVSLDQIQPGDLIFYYSDVHHVAIYVGNGSVIHAPFTGSTVSFGSMNGNVIGAARPG